jgi:hypothetical protein
MSDWITLSRQQHAYQRLKRRHGYGFCATHTTAPMALAELGKVAAHYPLAFQYQNGHVVPVALLGTTTNLYVAPNGRWLAGYVPASLRGYPLRVTAQGPQQVALEVAAEYLADTDGEAIFTEEGELTDAVKPAFQFLVSSEKSRQQAVMAAQALANANVLVPWPLTVTQPDGSSFTYSSLYQVDEKALHALDDATFAHLKGAPLQLAYAQQLAVSQLSELGKRAQLQAKLAEQQAPDNVPENLDGVFGDGDDELTFDFDS